MDIEMDESDLRRKRSSDQVVELVSSMVGTSMELVPMTKVSGGVAAVPLSPPPKQDRSCP